MTPTRNSFAMVDTPSTADSSPPSTSNTTSNVAIATNSVTIKIPPFWPFDPELWFAQVEAQFAIKQITVQNTKYSHVVAALSPEAATEVRDLILNPPETDPYNVLKKSLIERVSLSKRSEIHQLLHAEELGDRKPSQLLRRLQQLSGNTETDLLRELFLQRLPSHVQVGLSHPGKPLAELALIADGMIELVQSRQSIAQVETPESAEISSIRSDLNRVLKLLEPLSKKKPESPNPPTETICWYHSKFGARASKCRPPCSFSTAGNDNPVTSRGPCDRGFIKPPAICD